MKRKQGWAIFAGLATALWLASEEPARAQFIGGTGSSSGLGSGGSSGGSGLSGGMGSTGLGGSSSSSGGLGSSSFLPSGSSFLNSGTGITPSRSTSSTGAGNLFSGYNTNPMATGWAGLNSTGRVAAFGAPLYGSLVYGTYGQSGLTGTASLTTGRPLTSTFSPSTTGFIPGTPGLRGPAYAAVLGFTPPPIVPSQLQANLQQVIARSSSLPSGRNIQVVMDGPTVVLRGGVASERERRMAESLVRLSPGVRNVRNELEFRELTPAPTPVR